MQKATGRAANKYFGPSCPLRAADTCWGPRLDRALPPLNPDSTTKPATDVRRPAENTAVGCERPAGEGPGDSLQLRRHHLAVQLSGTSQLLLQCGRRWG